MQGDFPQEFIEHLLPRNSKAFGKPTEFKADQEEEMLGKSRCPLSSKDNSAKEATGNGKVLDPHLRGHLL